MNKKCCKCGVEKPLKDFVCDKRLPDGHNNICKECSNMYRNNRRHTNEEFRKANNASNLKHYYNVIKPNEAKMDKRRAYAIQYDKEHPAKKFNDKQIRRTTGTLETFEYTLILELFKHKCAYCGQDLDVMHLDHVVPVKDGSSTVFGNIVPSCPRCNLSKGSKSLEKWYLMQEYYDINRYMLIKEYQRMLGV